MSIWANVPTGPALPAGPGEIVDAVVVGGGPAAYTAAIYLARAKTSPVVLAGTAPGGQLMDSGLVENFPGFPDGIDGPELMTRMLEQAERAGARVFTLDADRIEYGDPHRVVTAEGTVQARSVIIATGSAPRRLGLAGETELEGVAYCAVCEAPLYAGRDVAVVGGGDSAMEEVLAVAKHARRVYLVHRRASFRATPVMVERVRALTNVQIIAGAVVRELLGAGGRLTGVVLDSGVELVVQGLFVAIGHTPRVELLPAGGVAGLADVPGVFVAGDVADHRFRQAVTAAGAGCAAALEAARYLDQQDQPDATLVGR